MDEHHLALIRVDAMLILTLCENIRDDSALVIIRDVASRIIESCSRTSKRSLSPVPSEVPVAKRGRHSPDADQEQSEKADLVEQSRRAGKFVIPFGKHQGKPIDATPATYLCWLMGVKQDGREFIHKTDEALTWTRARHAVTLAQVQTFLVWRCWACGSQDVRFRHARLCTSCWHNAE